MGKIFGISDLPVSHSFPSLEYGKNNAIKVPFVKINTNNHAKDTFIKEVKNNFRIKNFIKILGHKA